MRPLRPVSSVSEALTLPLQRTQGHHHWKDRALCILSPNHHTPFLPACLSFCLSHLLPSLAFWVVICTAYLSSYLSSLSSFYLLWGSLPLMYGYAGYSGGLLCYVGHSMARSEVTGAACCCPDTGHWPHTCSRGSSSYVGHFRTGLLHDIRCDWKDV